MAVRTTKGLPSSSLVLLVIPANHTANINALITFHINIDINVHSTTSTLPPTPNLHRQTQPDAVHEVNDTYANQTLEF